MSLNVKEVSADKAHSRRNNLAYVNSIGAVPYIPFRNNTTGKHRGNSGHIWEIMFNLFLYHREEFLEH